MWLSYICEQIMKLTMLYKLNDIEGLKTTILIDKLLYL